MACLYQAPSSKSESKDTVRSYPKPRSSIPPLLRLPAIEQRLGPQTDNGQDDGEEEGEVNDGDIELGRGQLTPLAGEIDPNSAISSHYNQ